MQPPFGPPRPFSKNLPLIEIITRLKLLDGLQLCLDAGDFESYSGGQKWLDRSGNGFDFFRGTNATPSTDDPTFNGTPGGLSDNEYWSFDGGDFFTYDSANEAWMNNLHKDNADFTLAGWIQDPVDGELFGTSSGAGAIGIRYRVIASGQSFVVFRAAAGVVLIVTSTGAMAVPTDGAPHFVALSVDEAGGAGASRFYTDGVEETFNGTYVTPSAAAAGNTLHLATAGDASDPFDAGAQMWMAMALSESLTKAQLDRIYNATRGRFGL